MARIRDLKPSFFRNEQLAELPHWTRLLFQGLWGIADRDGRLEDRPKRIGADVFPYEQLPIEQGLSDLARLGFIVRYTAGGVKLIQVVSFAKHQKPHPKEATNNFPPPDQADKQEPGNSTDKPGNSTAGSVGSLALGPSGSLGMGVPTTSAADAPDIPAPDPLYGTGLRFLKSKNIPDKQARSFLGKLRKTCGDVAAAALLADAEDQDISEPIPWLSRAAVNARAGPPRTKTAALFDTLGEMSERLDADLVSESDCGWPQVAGPVGA